VKRAILIGAGVIGSAIALELARAGFDITVVDKGAGAGQGSTSSSSAVIRFNYSTYDSVALAWESFHCWKNWQDHLGIDLPAYTRLFDVGVIMMDAPVISTTKTAALFGKVGVPFAIWSPQELAVHAPGIDTGRYWPPKPVTSEEFWEEASENIGAIFTPQGGYVDDPQLAAENLAEAAQANGAKFLFKSSVTKIIKDGNRVIGVEINGNKVLTVDVVINAAGPWSTKINELAGAGSDFTIGLRPMRQEVHQVDSPKNLLPGPIVGDIDLGIYMRSTPNGSTLVGGTEPECDPLEWVDDLEQVNMIRTQERFEAQVTRAARRLPALQMPNTPLGVVGVYDVSSDWTPIYDRTDVDGFYVAIGTSGNQFKNAPVVGQLMAHLITEIESGKDHDNDPVIFNGVRTGNLINLGAFSRKRPFNSESTNSVMG
jgi:glycine/D-amino acid oxidase-like deaminating enzyme